MKKHKINNTKASSDRKRTMMNELAIARYQYEQACNQLRHESEMLKKVRCRKEKLLEARLDEEKQKEMLYAEIELKKRELKQLERNKKALSETWNSVKECNNCISEEINGYKLKRPGRLALKRANSMPNVANIDESNSSGKASKQLMTALRLKVNVIRLRKRVQSKGGSKTKNKEETVKDNPSFPPLRERARTVWPGL